MSGVFMSADDANVQMVQLVETPDHRLTGRYESDRLLVDGTVPLDVVTIEGASSGHDLLLTIKPLSFLNAGISASGTINGDKLSIHGRGIDLNLNRTTLAEFNRAVARIKRRGEAIAQENAKQNAVRVEAAQRAANLQQAQNAANTAAQAQEQQEAKATEVRALTAELNARLLKADQVFNGLPDFSARFVANTQKMRALKPTDRALAEELVRNTDNENVARQSFGQKFSEDVEAAEKFVQPLNNLCTDQSEETSKPCIAAELVLMRYGQRKNLYIDQFQKLKDSYRAQRAAQIDIFNAKRLGGDGPTDNQ